MSRRALRWMVLAVGVLVSQAILAQQSDDNLTVEEHYLRRLQFQVLKEKAFSEDREMKSEALDELRTMIEGETVGEDTTEIEFILEYLSLEGSSILVREGQRLINDFPLIRTRATYLMGEIASAKAEEVLTLVLLHDLEPMVRAEAAYALGKIGLDLREVVSVLTFALGSQAMPDDNFAHAVLLGIEKVIERNTENLQLEISEALLNVAEDPRYVKKVREKAREVLRGLTS